MINFASRTTESILNSDVSQSNGNAGFWQKDGVDENCKWFLNVKLIPNSLGFGELSCSCIEVSVSLLSVEFPELSLS